MREITDSLRWVSEDRSQSEVQRCMEVSVQVFCMCMWVSVERVAYICGFAEGLLRTPQETLWYRSYSSTNIARLICNVYSLSGPFSLLWEP
jgi:hypothetical protein